MFPPRIALPWVALSARSALGREDIGRKGQFRMIRFIGNHAFTAAMCVLFTLALALNTLTGGTLPSFVNGLTFEPGVRSTSQEAADTLKHGPTFPPDPWEARARS